MAKVLSPLMSLKASGSIRKTLTYSNWKGVAIVKKWNKPTDQRTPAQSEIRSLFKSGVLAWKNLTQAEKEDYKEQAKFKPLTGFNIFIREYINNNSESSDYGNYGVNVYGSAIYGV